MKFRIPILQFFDQLEQVLLVLFVYLIRENICNYNSEFRASILVVESGEQE